MKKTLSTILILTLLISLFCTASSAVSSDANDFTVTGGVLIKYTGPGGDVVIPGNLGITEIGESAFLGMSMHGAASNTTLKSLIIPDGVTVIGDRAFESCTALLTVSLPDSVTSIGAGAFSGCTSLTAVAIPARVSVIADRTFSGCASLASAVLPNGLLRIGAGAFEHCTSLSSAELPPALTEMGDGAYLGCTALTSVSIPVGLTSFGDFVFADTGIGAPIFSGDGVVLYYVPDADGYVIPQTVTEIHGGAFYGCSELTSISIPSSITTIGPSAFMGCTGLKTVSIPAGITVLDREVFSECTNLVSVSLPDGLTTIGDNAFFGCKSLSSIDLPRTVSQIGSSSFAACEGIELIILPDGLTELSENIFNGCSSLASITLPAVLRIVGAGAFASCTALRSLDIPVGVTTIGALAFSDCPALETVTIPGTVVSIGENAFFAYYWAPNNTTIRGVPGSYAEAYARQFNKPFVATSAAKITPTASTVTVDGTPIVFEAYTIAGHNYFKLRDLAMVLSGTGKQFDVSWDAVTNAVIITTGTEYTPVGSELTFTKDLKGYSATLPPSKILLDGVEVPLTAYNVAGFNYFKLRDVAGALDFGVTWDGTANTIRITTSESYDETR